MKQPIVIVGMGELGDLFARGFLKLGYSVQPVLRGMEPQVLAESMPDPELVLLAVGEDDLQSALESMPEVWRKNLGLMQNELLPRDWERHGISTPTVIVVWFDKKKGRPFVAVNPTPVCGPKGALVLQALNRIEVPCHPIPPEELLYELVRKNLYILTINISGLRLPPGGTVSELWEHHRALAESVANEVLDLQQWLARVPLPRERLLSGMLKGFDGDPQHICTGRTAPKRLQRALGLAREAGIEVPMLQRIGDTIGVR